MGSLLILLLFFGLIVGIALWAVGIYNGLVTGRNALRTPSPRSTCSCSAAST